MERYIAISLLALAIVGCSSGDRTGATFKDSVATSPAVDGAGSSFGITASKAPAESMESGRANAQEPPRNGGHQAPVATANRHIIREGTLSVRVQDIDKAENQIMASLRSVGGYLEGADGASLASETPRLTMTVRIPVSQFDAFVSGVSKSGDLLSRTATAQDVTEQIVDAEARMKALRAEEVAYLEMLRQTRNLNDTLSVRSRLGEVRQQIEQLDAMRLALRGRAAMSSLRIDLTQAAPMNATASTDPGWFAQTLGGATGVLGEISRGIGGAAIYAGVLSPLWFPFVWFAWRGRKKALKEAAERRQQTPPVVQTP